MVKHLIVAQVESTAVDRVGPRLNLSWHAETHDGGTVRNRGLANNLGRGDGEEASQDNKSGLHGARGILFNGHLVIRKTCG